MTDDTAPSDSQLPSERPRRWKLPPHDDPRAESAIRAFFRGPALGTEVAENGETLVDPETGFATRRAWDEVFHHEEHYFARYSRPVTLVVAELEGVDSLAAVLGQSAANRLIPPVAAAMQRSAREADFLARTGHTLFVALLPETDEVAAINQVERVRSECDNWLEARGLAVRLALGWAQPKTGGRLVDALRLADDRMNADRRRQGFRAPRATAALFTYGEESPTSGG